MKTLFNRIAVVALACTLSVSAFAKEKSKTVKLISDTSVNGILLKKGTYKITFDESSNEVVFSNNKEVLVKTAAKFVPQNKEASNTTLTSKEQNSVRVLNSISLEGEKTMIVIDESANKAANPQ
jgi:hypothetical protein